MSDIMKLDLYLLLQISNDSNEQEVSLCLNLLKKVELNLTLKKFKKLFL
jgi:hypothetical protein